MNHVDTPDEAAEPRPPRPKRGAFPTPQAEIDKAPVFVPPGSDTGDRQDAGAAQSSSDEDADERS